MQRLCDIMDHFVMEILQRELDDPPNWSDNTRVAVTVWH